MKDLRRSLCLGVSIGVKLLVGLTAVKVSAQYLGPNEFGITGQISSLCAIIMLLAGGGVSVGVTKIYADRQFVEASREAWNRAAGVIVTVSALSLLGIFLLTSSRIQDVILQGRGDAKWILAGLVLAIAPIGYSSIAQGRINGRQRDDIYSIAVIIGSLVGLFGFLVLSHGFGTTGALTGMVWLPIAQALVFIVFGKKSKHEQQSRERMNVDLAKCRFLLSYGALSIAAGTIMPLLYIGIRLMIHDHNSSEMLGLWQATVRISEAYMQLPILMLSVVFFAQFASSASSPLTRVSIIRVYAFMGGLMLVIATFVYFTRNYWIDLVFTPEFHSMEAYVLWQLAGDGLRILSYVGTTILAARGAVKLCLLGEFAQGLLLTLSSTILIPRFGAIAPFYAYLAAYSIYFVMTLVALRMHSRIGS